MGPDINENGTGLLNWFMKQKSEVYGYRNVLSSINLWFFLEYNKLQQNAFCVVSDSGTLPEESAFFKFPAVSVRTSTERPGAAFEVCGVSLMLPLVTAVMNDNIINENAYAEKVCALFHIESHIGFVMLCIVALIVLYILKTVYLVFEYYIQYRFIGNNQFATQEKLLNTYLHRPYEFFLSAESGEIVRIVQSDTEKTFDMLAVLLLAASETVVAFALLVTVFVISPLMTGFVAVVIALMLLIIVKAVKPLLQKQGVRYQESYAENNKWLLQAVSGIKEIKVTRTENFFLENYAAYGKRRVHAFRIHNTLQNIPRLLIEVASVGSMLAVVGIMIAGGRSMQSLIPALGAFVMAAVKLLPSANRIVAAVNQIAFYEPALDNMLSNTGQTAGEEKFYTQGNGKPLALKHEINLAGISYTYPGGKKKIFDRADLVCPYRLHSADDFYAG